MEQKLLPAEIVGLLSANNTIVEIELSVALEVYGDNIPARRIKEILENLQRRMKQAEEAWENRA
jgi:hypothetical protein